MAQPILEVRGLSVSINKEKALKDVSIEIERGQIYVLFGPNGSGKTSLLLTLMGYPGYHVTGGTIHFDGKDITKKSIDERARLGIGMGYQLPQEIRGVKLLDVLKICAGKKPSEELSNEEMALVEKFRLTDMLDRDVNMNFSGGERKRAEMLQLLLMKPKLLLLDEPDSGVDLESLKLIGEEIQKYVEENNASALVITHQGYVLENMKAERACVLLENTIHCHNKPLVILEEIRRSGYKKCVQCWEGRKAK